MFALQLGSQASDVMKCVYLTENFQFSYIFKSVNFHLSYISKSDKFHFSYISKKIHFKQLNQPLIKRFSLSKDKQKHPTDCPKVLISKSTENIESLPTKPLSSSSKNNFVAFLSISRLICKLNWLNIKYVLIVSKLEKFSN